MFNKKKSNKKIFVASKNKSILVKNEKEANKILKSCEKILKTNRKKNIIYCLVGEQDGNVVYSLTNVPYKNDEELQKCLQLYKSNGLKSYYV